MITSVILRNLKQFQEQPFDDLGQFHLLVGQNNSGKSTLLHALAIWQFCVEEFRASKRKGGRGTEIILPNFTPLPLPDFKLLWHNKLERRYPETQEIDRKTGKPKKRQEFIYIEIEVKWQTAQNQTYMFTVRLRYNTRQSVYATPVDGWENFRQLDANGDPVKTVFPKIVYVPPTSNIEDQEQWKDDSVIRATVGRGRPGSVVRNMLLRALEADQKLEKPLRYPQPFHGLQQTIYDWFAIQVSAPIYRQGQDQFITATYRTGSGIELDWVNAGSGVLQTLIVLSFLYGFQPDVLLLDEPDAHLHVNLQRTLLTFLQRQPDVQMLIATHAEFIRRVDASQITFLTPEGPKRISRNDAAILALSEISNLDLLNLIERKLLIYVEGETDAEILRAWAEVLQDEPEFAPLKYAMTQVTFVPMHGGNAEKMKEYAEKHYEGARLLSQKAERIILLDRNEGKWNKIARDNPVLHVWQRRHIENYLLAPEAWKQVAYFNQFPLMASLVDSFFAEQGFAASIDWLSDTVEVLRTSNAKQLLFEARKERGDGFDALNARLYQGGLVLTRADIAHAMRPAEIHADVRDVFKLIQSKVGEVAA
jgi:hypothetical protein